MEPLTNDDHAAPPPLLPERTKRFWAPGVFLSVVLVLFLGAGLSAPAAFPKGDGALFTIADGETLKGVASALAEGGYVRSAFALDALVAVFGGEHRISPGDYRFREGEGALGIAWQIARGRHDVEPVKVTVPEGEDAAQIAALLASKLPGFDANAFIADAEPDEGYLFPETYFFYPSATPEDIVAAMRAMFDAQTAGLFTATALSGRTEAQVVTMASIVEREASGNGDRATIAGILWKRLSLGMRLEVDSAPVTYAQGGLPSEPIDNPGLLAIQAALDPAATPYLYYLHDKNGTIHYAKTYAEHQANIAKYL